jgi:hypothetical protein
LGKEVKAVDFLICERSFSSGKIFLKNEKSTAFPFFLKILLDLKFDTRPNISHSKAESLAFMPISKKNEFIMDKKARDHT